jgi:uncharacterized DUF497 family protein
VGPQKAKTNLAEHGISFECAIEIFTDPLALSKPDLRYDDRWVTIGEARAGLIVVVHVDVEDFDDEGWRVRTKSGLIVMTSKEALARAASTELPKEASRKIYFSDIPEQHFTGPGRIHGKHYAAMQAARGFVLLEPDARKVFSDAQTVNRVSRMFISDFAAGFRGDMRLSALLDRAGAASLSEYIKRNGKSQ